MNLKLSNSNRSLISIGLTAFNCSDKVKLAIKSDLSQTWRPIEIIVVDDCSDDNTRKVLKSLTKVYPDWVLIIVGEGEKRNDLEQLVADTKLTDRVELIGAAIDVDAWYHKSSFLEFPSLWVGFPNVLIEAFRQGLPAIGLIQTTDVNELLHNETGILASNNEASIALAIQAFIDDFEFRCRAGRAARNSMSGFEPEVIFNEWDNLFSRLVKRH
jgi:glycosyltransferase involved in cell wall biosynthesis